MSGHNAYDRERAEKLAQGKTPCVQSELPCYVGLHRELTELVGVKFHQIDELNKGKLPTEYDITKWVDKYQGRKDLPPHMVELNNFRYDVDHFVSMIMMIVQRNT
jgi:hypothetical protein